ncbi:MAG TPA: hypothetical protein VM328_09290 [Fimbriimonadaceae bacterium]|nr:hypothetical protein [Fimbriimonadaceae bacterium]
MFHALIALLSFQAAGIAQDTKSVESIVAAVYDVISGPAGKKRDWDRMRSLFLPEARMVAVGRRQDGTTVSRAMTVEDYIARSGPLLEERGFFEREVARRVERFGSLAHVWSTYEARQKVDDEKPMMRGINSIQLFNDGQRWWVLTIYWQPEGPETPLPEKYLKDGS